uniref:Uncharacterized protein n=1 Tax=Anopheles culicifacies TaxID=139723 RepID=A0A182MVY8_9DIPT
MWTTHHRTGHDAGGRYSQLLLAFVIVLMLNVLTVHSLIHSPPRIIKQPPPDEMLFQVAQQGESDKPFLIECEAEGEPTPKSRKVSELEKLILLGWRITRQGGSPRV